MGAESDGRFLLRVIFKDASGAWLGQADAESALPESLTMSWKRFEGRVTAPAGAATAELRIWPYHNGGWVAVDDVRFTKSPTIHYRLGGREVAFSSSQGLQYLFSDHLGSSTVTYRPSDGQVRRQYYRPYGDVRYSDGLDTELGFTGQRADVSTGLMFYGARYYDPTLGRFVTPDTVVPNPANPQDLNRYSYVRNNPMVAIDPSGHVPRTPMVEGTCTPAACRLFSYSGGGGFSWEGARSSSSQSSVDLYTGAVEKQGPDVAPPQDTPSTPNSSRSWDWLVRYPAEHLYFNADASLLVWGAGFTVQGDTATLDLGGGWAGPTTLLGPLEGKIGAAAATVGWRSASDRVIGDESYSLEVFGIQGLELQFGRTTDGSGPFGWWIGVGGGLGIGVSNMTWHSVILERLPND